MAQECEVPQAQRELICLSCHEGTLGLLICGNLLPVLNLSLF
jgi:hypothetical protein